MGSSPLPVFPADQGFFLKKLFFLLIWHDVCCKKDVVSANVQHRSDKKIPMPIRRRWSIFRRQFLPTIAFSAVILFTLFFWKIYIMPVGHPQGIQTAQKKNTELVIGKAPAKKAVTSSVGMISE